MEFEEFLKKTPKFTKVFLASTLIVAILSSLSVINPMSFILDYEKVFYKFQIWRLFTAFVFAGGVKLQLIFTMFYIHFSLSNCEEYFKARIHDFYYLVALSAVVHCFVGYILDIHQVMMA